MRTSVVTGSNSTKHWVLKEGSVAVKIHEGKQKKAGRVYVTFWVVYHEGGDRVRKAFADFDAAKQHAETTLIRLVNGVTASNDLRPVELQEVAMAKAEAAKANVGLLTAVREYRQAFELLGGKTTVIEAVKSFLKSGVSELRTGTAATICEEMVRAKKSDGLSPRYCRDLRLRCGKFAKAFPKPITEIKTSEIEAWLRDLKAKAKNRNNYGRAITGLFNYAKRAGYLPSDRVTAADSLVRAKDVGGKIEIYTIDELSRALLRLKLFKPEMLPFVAIGAFAGIRTAELERLNWEEIDFKNNLIEITATKAKTAQRRFVPIQPNLAAWLADHQTQTGKVCPSKKTQLIIRRFLAKSITHEDGTTEAGISWKPNALRHSYGSYRLPIVKNAAELALEMGNSPSMIFRHYRELVKPAQALEYWVILPPKLATSN